MKAVSKLGVVEKPLLLPGDIHTNLKPLLLLGDIHTNLSVSTRLGSERWGVIPLRSGTSEGRPLSIQNLVQHHT